jgi:hypothetical protein
MKGQWKGAMERGNGKGQWKGAMDWDLSGRAFLFEGSGIMGIVNALPADHSGSVVHIQ